MNILITLVIALICLVILCMVHIVNCHNNIKKHTTKISHLYTKTNDLGYEIWGLKYPPKYKIGDEVYLYSSKKSTLVIRDIKLNLPKYAEDCLYWTYLLDNKDAKYKPIWYDERVIIMK